MELEKFITEMKGVTELDLSRENLTDQDMEIVAYYALQEDEVSDVVFYVIITERNRIFLSMSLSGIVYKNNNYFVKIKKAFNVICSRSSSFKIHIVVIFYRMSCSNDHLSLWFA